MTGLLTEKVHSSHAMTIANHGGCKAMENLSLPSCSHDQTVLPGELHHLCVSHSFCTCITFLLHQMCCHGGDDGIVMLVAILCRMLAQGQNPCLTKKSRHTMINKSTFAATCFPTHEHQHNCLIPQRDYGFMFPRMKH